MALYFAVGVVFSDLELFVYNFALKFCHLGEDSSDIVI